MNRPLGKTVAHSPCGVCVLADVERGIQCKRASAEHQQHQRPDACPLLRPSHTRSILACQPASGSPSNRTKLLCGPDGLLAGGLSPSDRSSQIRLLCQTRTRGLWPARAGRLSNEFPVMMLNCCWRRSHNALVGGHRAGSKNKLRGQGWNMDEYRVVRQLPRLRNLFWLG